MKHILIILLAFAGVITALHAADPVVVVLSATSVTVDGVDYGKPLDAIANNPQLASPIQRALEKWMGVVEKDKVDAQDKLQKRDARLDALLKDKLEKELKSGEGPKAQMLRQLRAEALKTDDEIQLDALEADLAARQQEIKKLKAKKP